MYQQINPEDYTVPQLKEWLAFLGQPTNGNKNALISRLNEIPSVKRNVAWGPSCSRKNTEANDETDSTNSNKKDECNGAQCKRSEKSGEIEKRSNDETRAVIEEQEKMEENEGQQLKEDQQQKTDASTNEKEKESNEGEQMSANGMQMSENYVLMIENDLQMSANKTLSENERVKMIDTNESNGNATKVTFLEEENELSQREKQLMRANHIQMSANETLSGNEKAKVMIDINESDGNANKMKLLEKENELLQREKQLMEREMAIIKRQLDSLSVNTWQSPEARSNGNANTLELAKDFLPIFDGGQHFDIWAEQFAAVRNNFRLDENSSRALLVKKLSNKAQSWLFSKPNFASTPVDTLLGEMNEYFGNKESKMTLRKKFENRKWQQNESFPEYYTYKIMASHKLNIDTEELIDCIIEGIPNTQMRMQARLQCFSSESQLLQAFSKMRLPNLVNNNTNNNDSARCYNCNSRGHQASECRKPKREPGACYVCGSLQHRAADCDQHKSKNNAS